MSNKCKWEDGKFVACDENSLRKIDIEYDR